MAKATELWAGRADALAVAGDRALVAAAGSLAVVHLTTGEVRGPRSVFTGLQKCFYVRLAS